MTAKMMSVGRRAFFSTAAIFNGSVGFLLLAIPQVFYLLTALQEPDRLFETRIVGWMILVFGALYFVTATSPTTPRSLITLFAIGKLGATAFIVTYWANGSMNLLGLAVGAADFLWALGFLYYSRPMT